MSADANLFASMPPEMVGGLRQLHQQGRLTMTQADFIRGASRNYHDALAKLADAQSEVDECADLYDRCIHWTPQRWAEVLLGIEVDTTLDLAAMSE
jgi:hypothetical protein